MPAPVPALAPAVRLTFLAVLRALATDSGPDLLPTVQTLFSRLHQVTLPDALTVALIKEVMTVATVVTASGTGMAPTLLPECQMQQIARGLAMALAGHRPGDIPFGAPREWLKDTGG